MLTLPRRLTYDDYRRIPDDGRRHEILDGEVYVSPSPGVAHQHASAALFLQLARVVAQDLRVYYAPLDVILGPHDVVQPDLVVASLTQFSARGVEGAPRVMVEITSPGRPEYDRTIKARRYASAGVPAYWLVDPEARTLECFALDAGAYVLVSSGRGADTIEAAGLTGLSLSLGPLWLDLPAMS